MNSSQVLWALVAILGVQSAAGLAVLTLGRRESVLAQWLPFLVSGAAGVLLSTACLDLLPEAVRAPGSGMFVWQCLLASLVALFCIQAIAHWFTDEALDTPADASKDAGSLHGHGHSHVHHHGHPTKKARPGALLLGSALHSTVDGVAIVAAFAAGPRAGWSAALAIGLHELPHRIGDFALLLHLGIPRRRAALLAVSAGGTALLGGLAVVFAGEHRTTPLWLLPVSAATFLYIALVDLVPELQATRRGSAIWGQIVCLAAGAALMAVLIQLSGE